MLTPDIKRLIASQLNLQDSYNLFQVNKSWSTLAKDERFWKIRLELDFEITGELCFRDRYIHELNLDRQRRAEQEFMFVDCEANPEWVYKSSVSHNTDKYVHKKNLIRIRYPKNIDHEFESWLPIFDQIRQTSCQYKYLVIAILKYLITHCYPQAESVIFVNNSNLTRPVELYCSDEPMSRCVLFVDKFYDTFCKYKKPTKSNDHDNLNQNNVAAVPNNFSRVVQILGIGLFIVSSLFFGSKLLSMTKLKHNTLN